MESRAYLLAGIGVTLSLAAVFLASGVTIPPDRLIVPDRELLTASLELIPAIALIILSNYVLRWTSASLRIRAALWTINVAIVLLASILLRIDPVTAAFLAGAVVGGIVMILAEDECKLRRWTMITSSKGVAFAIIFVLLLWAGKQVAPALKPVVINKIVDLALAGTGTPQTGIDVNEIVPPGVTPQERQEIVASIERSIPNWSQLSDAQRQQIIQQYLQQYLGIKEGIRRALEKGLRKPDKTALRQAVIQQIDTMPVFKMLFDNLYYVFAFVGTMLYSIVTLFAEPLAYLLAWLLDFILALRRDASRQQS